MSTDRIVITAPHVSYGPFGVPPRKADADYLREGAKHLEGGYPLGGSNLTRTVVDLLRDVAGQIDAPAETAPIIIDRADLPEVEPEVEGYSGYVTVNGQVCGLRTVESYDKSIRLLLALRGYVTAHPPVDEADVEALTVMMVRANEGDDFSDLARRLLASGKVAVVRP